MVENWAILSVEMMVRSISQLVASIYFCRGIGVKFLCVHDIYQLMIYDHDVPSNGSHKDSTF